MRALLLILVIQCILVATFYGQHLPCDAREVTHGNNYHVQFPGVGYPAFDSDFPCSEWSVQKEWGRFQLDNSLHKVVLHFNEVSEPFQVSVIAGVWDTDCTGKLIFSEGNFYCGIIPDSIEFSCLPPGEVFFMISTGFSIRNEFSYRLETEDTSNDCIYRVCNNAQRINLNLSSTVVCSELCAPPVCDRSLILNNNLRSTGNWFRLDFSSQSNRYINVTIETDFDDPIVQFFQGNCVAHAFTGIYRGRNGKLVIENLEITPGSSQRIFVVVRSQSGKGGHINLCTEFKFVEYRSCTSMGRLTYSSIERVAIGDIVDFYWEFNYSSINNGCQWLHGIVPRVGSNWEIIEEDIYNQFRWFDYGVVTYKNFNVFRHLIFQDTDGRWTFCNPVNNPDCEGMPLTQGMLMPAGWYFYSHNNLFYCQDFGGGILNDPNQSWGIPCSCDSTCNIYIPFKLRYKGPVNDTTQNIHPDAIQFFNFGDGDTGCWHQRSNVCVNDDLYEFRIRYFDCADTDVYRGEFEVCSGATFHQVLTSDFGKSGVRYYWYPISDTNVIGATEDVGNLFIQNMINLSDTIETVIFEVRTIHQDGCRLTEIGEIKIHVHPQIIPDIIVDNDTVTIGTEINLFADFSGYAIGNYTFTWLHNESTEFETSAIVDQTGILHFGLKIIDSTGCISYVFKQIFAKESLHGDEELSFNQLNDPHKLNKKIQFFPNPFDKIITLDKSFDSKGGNLIVRDLDGKILFNVEIMEGSESFLINIPDLKPGTYLFEYQSESFQSTQRMIKIN